MSDVSPPDALPREVELKLELSPADLPRLQRHRLFRAPGSGRATTRTLRTIYFDTPGLDLVSAGINLRVRRVGRSWIQTVKLESRARAGLFDRTEFECPVPAGRPDLTRLSDSMLRATVEAAAGEGPLVPVVETEFKRTRRTLEVAGTQIFADLDVGEVRARDERIPLCELELELVSGDPGALFDVALELQQSVSLRPCGVSKSERGYASLTGATPEPTKAGRVHLPEGASLEDALAAAVASCVDQILANEVPAFLGTDTEGVHQMRVGVRRLRSALSFFAEVLPTDHIGPLREELRWLADVLGGVRDLDVFIEETLAPLLARFGPDLGIESLDKEAQALRGQRRETLREALGSPRYARLLLQLGRWHTARGWRDQPLSENAARLFLPVRDAVVPMLDARDKKVRKRGRRMATLPIEERHRLRVQLKKLRYAVEFLQSTGDRRGAKRYVRGLARLQDTLGHLNDVATCVALLDALIDRIGDAANPAHHRAVGFVAGWTARQAERRVGRSERDWKAFAREDRYWK